MPRGRCLPVRRLISFTPMRFSATLLFVLLLATAATASADKKKKVTLGQVEPIYALPEPEVLWTAPLPDTPLPAPVELKPLFRHTANLQQQGIDVSHYQGHIRWEEVACDGKVQFAYVKATESSGYVDDCYLRNLYGAKQARIPVGVYHFFSPTASALMQLENFRSNVDPRQQDLIPIVDVEKRGKGSLSQFHGRLRAFLEGVERIYGVKPIIYTGVNFYAKYLEGKFTQYRFMVARYAEEIPSLSDDVPILMWQYTCTGSVNGIKGDVDCSVFLDKYSVADIMLKKTP